MLSKTDTFSSKNVKPFTVNKNLPKNKIYPEVLQQKIFWLLSNLYVLEKYQGKTYFKKNETENAFQTRRKIFLFFFQFSCSLYIVVINKSDLFPHLHFINRDRHHKTKTDKSKD